MAKSEDTFDTFKKCKAELISIFKVIIQSETWDLKLVRKLKKQDIK